MPHGYSITPYTTQPPIYYPPPGTSATVPGGGYFFAWGGNGTYTVKYAKVSYYDAASNLQTPAGKLVTNPALPAGKWAFEFTGIVPGPLTPTVTLQIYDAGDAGMTTPLNAVQFNIGP